MERMSLSLARGNQAPPSEGWGLAVHMPTRSVSQHCLKPGTSMSASGPTSVSRSYQLREKSSGEKEHLTPKASFGESMLKTNLCPPLHCWLLSDTVRKPPHTPEHPEPCQRGRWEHLGV